MLIEEEQVALLGKMLLYSVDHLTGREREVYDTLVESLSRRVNRLQRLEKRTEQLKKVPGEPDREVEEKAEERELSKKSCVRDLSPDDVVKLFIESWNTGDFGVEYFCLSPGCERGGRKNTPLDQYVSSRRQRWENREIAGIIRKWIVEKTTSDMKGNRAEVDCVEAHGTAQEEIHLWRTYTLLYEDGGWRILDFVTRRRANRPVSQPT